MMARWDPGRQASDLNAQKEQVIMLVADDYSPAQ
jgi:hypothetical protein